MEKKKVNIVLRSTSRIADSEPETMELITDGTLERLVDGDKSGWRVTYNDAELTGYVDSSTTVSCFGNDTASMHRTGDLTQELVMENGQLRRCLYETEYGSMLFGVYTKSIENTISDEGGELKLSYSIESNGDLVADNRVELSITGR
ncbi:MAG: DUF1934 domain-containing protein [Ruminococcus sp.]|nr:DUF1934 domain-containing protein [Ruminococcus sp.]